MSNDSFLATIAQIIFRVVELHGLDAQHFIRDLGGDPAHFRDPQARLPSRFADKAIQKAAALIPDPAFGLCSAECWHPSHLGVLGYAWLASATLRAGLQQIERFARIVTSKATIRCVDEPGGLRFIYDHQRGDAPVGLVLADFVLALVLAMCRVNRGSSLHPSVVYLRRPEPDDPQPYLDCFGAPIQFGAPEDSFVLAAVHVDAPLPSGNHDLKVTFDALLTEQLAALVEDDLVTRCKAYLMPRLATGAYSEEALAIAMGLSRRTLQRQLGECGLTYTDVLDATRHTLAVRYLHDQERPVSEITFLLGFSEQSAFTRAFRRWTGQPPAARPWRNQSKKLARSVKTNRLMTR